MMRRGYCRPALVALVAMALSLSPALTGEVREELSRGLETDPQRAAAAASRVEAEVYRLRWKLGGFLGALASLLLPGSGDALLTFTPVDEQRLEVQVLITTPRREGAYFVYGAQIDPAKETTTEIWSSYFFRDSKKEREQRIEEEGIIDFASAIYHLRHRPPSKPVQLTIWNQGKTYPAEVRPLKPERRKISGTRTEVQGYEVRGAKVDGKRAFGYTFTLYFSRNADHTPVEITGKQGWFKLRMQLVEDDVQKLTAKP